MSTSTIRRAIASVLRCTGLSRRVLAVPEPAAEDVVLSPSENLTEIEVQEPIPEGILDSDDDLISLLEEDMAPVVEPAPRPVCQDPTPGSYAWWTSHAWVWVDNVYICDRCERVWPAPHGDPDHD